MTGKELTEWVVGQVLHRVEDVHRMGFEDEDGIRVFPITHVEHLTFRVERVTAKGGWLVATHREDDTPTWLPFNTRRVSTTHEIAMQEAIRRRTYHVKMSRHRLQSAESRLRTLQSAQERLQRSLAF